MNCTKSTVGSSPTHILLPLFMQSSHIAWAVTVAFSGCHCPALGLSGLTHTAHLFTSNRPKSNSGHLLKSNRAVPRLSQKLLPLKSTYPRSFRIHSKPSPWPHIFLSSAPLRVMSPTPTPPSVDLLVAFHIPCFLPSLFRSLCGWNALLSPALAW